ncbi:MAG: hypothetical protein IJD01_05370 [Clostridia bacterium]|nr:hypothetical protein [Clostridia bacterium]
MRQLTIKRRKVYAACLAKMTVYIEDHQAPEGVLGGLPCRRLGELKNGEEQTFTVSDSAATVFVAPANLTTDRYLERLVIPEGTDDMVLEGQCYINILGGNGFCFDANNNAASAKKRKKSTLLGVLLLIAVGVVSGLVSYFVTSALVSPSTAPKDFSSHGLTITLTDEFSEMEVEGFTAAFDSDHLGVIALREPFYLAAGFSDYSLEEYARLVIEANGLTSEVQTRDGQVVFEYDAFIAEADADYHYVAYVFKSKDAFWTVTFTMLESCAHDHREQIDRYASSVRFY